MKKQKNNIKGSKDETKSKQYEGSKFYNTVYDGKSKKTTDSKNPYDKNPTESQKNLVDPEKQSKMGKSDNPKGNSDYLIHN